LSKPTIIIITGAPGTGKTTLGRQLAADLKLPFVYKDGIKERLYDTMGLQDREWSRRLGRAAYALLEHFAEVLLQAGQSFIIESNFDKELALPMFVGLQERWGYRPLQIWCRTEPELLLERFKARTAAGTRHPGHQDELVHEHFTAEKLAASYGFFDIGGVQVVWETTDFSAVDYAGLLRQVAHFGESVDRKTLTQRRKGAKN
jgi:predicted kinase